MKVLILILSINFIAVVWAEKANQIQVRGEAVRRLKIKPHEPEPETDWEHHGKPWEEHHEKPQHHVCKEKCRCLPDVDSVAFTPIRELKVTENTVLVCSDDSKIKRLETIADIYSYNVTCNGVLVTKNGTENIFDAIFEGKEPNSERKETLNVNYYRRISHFNQGSESYWSRSIITNTECAGDTIIYYGHWVVEDPLYGCCKQGVNLWTSVFSKVEVKGKCCSTCWLLQSAYGSDTLLKA